MPDPSAVAAWDEVAESYGGGASPFGRFPEDLARRAAVTPGERVVDLGCGNGLGLRALVGDGSGPIVVGVDFSADMLRASRDRLGARPGYALARADVTALPFADGAFDVAVSCSVFQFVGYAVDALREWRRVVAPGTQRFAVCVARR